MKAPEAAPIETKKPEPVIKDPDRWPKADDLTPADSRAAARLRVDRTTAGQNGPRYRRYLRALTALGLEGGRTTGLPPREFL